MPNKTNSSSNRAVLVLGLLAAMGVGGLATYVRMSPRATHVPEDLRVSASRSEDVPPTTQTKPPSGPSVDVRADQVELLVPKIDGETPKLGDPAGVVPKGIKPMVFLATETFKSLNLDGARALGVQVKDRMAHLDVNEALADFGFGSTQEGQVVQALQMALGQFPDIDTFDLNCDGKKLNTLGQLDLEEPIKVLRPGQTPDAPPIEG